MAMSPESSSSSVVFDEDEAEDTVTCSSILSPKSGPFGRPSSRISLLPCTPAALRDEEKEETTSSFHVPASSSWPSLTELASVVGAESYYTKDELEMPDGDLPTEESDLRPTLSAVRQFWIVTTAALPWMTGTAINPLLRAAYLSQMNRPYSHGLSTVTLVLPWLESSEDRVALYGDEWKDSTQADQEDHIRRWLAKSLPLEADLDQGGVIISWYAARYHARYASIFAMGDICSLFGDKKLDVCFLEEPEHLNVYRAPGKRLWTEIFRHVVGVGHTNYVAYVQKESLVASAFTYGLSSWMVKAYCHKLIKLSPVLQTYAEEKEVVSNVHGIRAEFLKVPPPKSGVYFLGKLLWAKGLDMLLKLEREHRRRTGDYFQIDIIGAGPDQEEIQASFDAKKVPAQFVGRKDHLEYCAGYKVFVNPSLSEVLCTATAEAIAMGKFVIIPVHPSNTFFEIFPNCLLYRNTKEFISFLKYALNHAPEPLSDDLRHTLTWEAATERCLEAAIITRRDAKRLDRVGQTKSSRDLAKLHNDLNRGAKGNVFRTILGAGPVANQHAFVTACS